MRYVHKAVVNVRVINAFDTSEFIKEPEDYEIGFYTNKKKALDAVIKMIDDEIIFACKHKVEVELYDKVDYDISCRMETYGEITWYLGHVERIRVK